MFVMVWAFKIDLHSNNFVPHLFMAFLNKAAMNYSLNSQNTWNTFYVIYLIDVSD